MEVTKASQGDHAKQGVLTGKADLVRLKHFTLDKAILAQVSWLKHTEDVANWDSPVGWVMVSGMRQYLYVSIHGMLLRTPESVVSRHISGGFSDYDPWMRNQTQIFVL